MDVLQRTPKTVIRCYELLDAAIAGGVKDFTDGMYLGDPTIPYVQAQKNQADWLINQVISNKGQRLLDVGCGNGRILEAARGKGVQATGITISKQQLRRCRAKGLDVYLMDYLELPERWANQFDGIIANGTIEHFVQPQDAIDDKQNDIYQNMFRIIHRLLKSDGKLVTTTIHFNQTIDPNDILKGSKAYRKGDSNYHFAQVLLEDFGGWYPQKNQLVDCASETFKLLDRQDGTQDYHWTSEYWLKEMKKQIPRNSKVWWALLKKMFIHPNATFSMLDNLIISQSWMWQFRELEDEKTPTRLYRDVWEKVT